MTSSEPMKLSSRAKALKPSPTLAMANRARELQAQGVDVVSLAVGEPDWPGFPEALEAGVQAIQSGFTKYTAAHGIPELREAIARQTEKELGVKYEASEVVVGTGAKYILFSALQMLIDPEDVVLIPAPYWVSYPVMAELAGAHIVEIPSRPEDRFKISAASLEAAIKESAGRARVLMFCSPNNPTGISYNRRELEGIVEVLRSHPEVTVLSDDIYNRLVFSADKSEVGPMALHLLHVAPDLRNQVIVVNSVSKSCAMTGWRVGWALGPKRLIQPLADFLSQSTSNICSIAQKAALRAIQVQDERLPNVLKMLSDRRKLFEEGLSQVPGLRIYSPDGAFYLWVGVEAWIGKKHPKVAAPFANSKMISEALLEVAGIAVVPGVEFGVENHLRLSLAASESNLRKAIERLKDFGRGLV